MPKHGKVVKVITRLDVETWKRLRIAAIEDDITVDGLLKEFIKRYLEEREKVKNDRRNKNI